MDIFIDRNSSVPPYLQIKDRIKDFISNGEYKENQSVTSIREISRITGISLATVQKAYRELKQDKCIYAKAGAGYFVSRQSSLSDTVFVLLPNSRLSFYTYILDGMFEANRNNDLTIQVSSLNTDKLAWNEKTVELLQVARRDKCAVIFIEEAFGEMRKECLATAKKVPFVAIEWILENATSIVNDYRRAGYCMVEYLVTKRNAKSIFVMKGREKQYNARERILGMREAAREYRLVEGRNIVYVDTDFDAISAYETIKKHYPSMHRCDAVICANDYEAMGAIGAFMEKRVLVGKDVALVGFGNMIEPVTTHVPLTTMDQRLKLIGIRAIQSINNLRKGTGRIGSIVTLPAKLIERKT
ncbi:MAG: LacI family DNA-binding transcriptional regulator [Chitinispirillaceae bacterium]|nr:LacI family DNA-binding transcriptional regulator [Chitinispirillaceae bacterium]